MFNNRLVFYSQKEVKAAKRSEFFSHLSVSELFECKQDRSVTIRNLSKWNLSGCWILWQVKRGIYLSITNELTSDYQQKVHNVSKILIPLLCTCLTDFLDFYKPLISINLHCMPVGRKKVVVVSNLSIPWEINTASWHFRNNFLLPFSLPFPQSLVKHLSRGQDAALYILTMLLVIISLFSFYYNSLAVKVSSPRNCPLKLTVQFPTTKRPIPLR